MGKNKSLQFVLELDELFSEANCSINDPDYVPPVCFLDIQQLILHAFLKRKSTFKPRWCRLKNNQFVDQVVVLYLDNVCYDEVVKEDTEFEFLNTFSNKIKLISALQYGISPIHEFLAVPFSFRPIFKCDVPNTNDNEGGEGDSNKMDDSASTAMVENEPEASQSGDDVISDITSEVQSLLQNPTNVKKSDLLLNVAQMMHEGYPLPSSTVSKLSHYIFSHKNYTPVTDSSPLFALDCEMCKTGKKLELTRVSILNENGDVIYNSLVKPDTEIIDYLTEFSGITKEILENVDVDLSMVQKKIQALIPPDAILCGHSLNGDLHALQMLHPYIIDTSVLFNIRGQRHMKSKLKQLTKHFLNREIQNQSIDGHCPTEDAKAALDLVHLKLEKGLLFGDNCLSKKSLARQRDENDAIFLWKQSLFTETSLRYQNLFSILDTNSISSSVIGFEENEVEIFLKNVPFRGLNYEPFSSNRRAEEYTNDAIKEKKFIFTQFTTQADCLTDDVTAFKKTLNTCIEQLFNRLTKNTLMVVLLSGTDKQYAGCFVKIR